MRTSLRIAVWVLVLGATGGVTTSATGVELALFCGSTVTESTKLTHDIGSEAAPCQEDGLTIEKKGITLDLNGHTIWGNETDDVAPIETGISVHGVNDVTIKNGTVRGFEFGVSVASAKRPVVSGVVSADNTIHGMVASMSDGVIKNNRLIGNDGDGLYFGGVGKVVGNDASHNSGAGFRGVGATKGVVRSNRAFANGGHGMDIGTGGSPGVVVVSNHAGSNGGNGISVSKSPLVEANVATDNFDAGLAMSNVERIVSNYSTDNFDGLRIAHSSPGAMTIEGNQAHGNDDDGLQVEPSAGTKVVKNRANANGDNGIEVAASVTKVRLTGNRVSGNGEGIFAEQLVSPLIDGNTATGNGMIAENGLGLGINAAGTTNPKGANTAYGNDDPDECDPTSLCPD